MGILDDLAMGFGLKERTEDYDARTARTIALNEQYDNEFDRIRARESGDYDVTRGGAAQFLRSRGRDNPTSVRCTRSVQKHQRMQHTVQLYDRWQAEYNRG